MKLKNGRFNYTNSHKEYIGYDQLRRCLFRFLKEFGYYSAYINSIKPYMVDYYYSFGDFFPVEEKITFKEFIRRNYKALSRMMFPGGELWE